MEGNHEHKAALPNGTRLRQYRIEKVLGVGSFGVTYLAHDNDLQSHFAIKEYIPNEFALREGATVHPKSSANEDDYRWGLSRFLQEARELAKFRHANIVRVHQIFEENNTAYMVLDFEEGVNFDRWLKNLGAAAGGKGIARDFCLRCLMRWNKSMRMVYCIGTLPRTISSFTRMVSRCYWILARRVKPWECAAKV